MDRVIETRPSPHVSGLELPLVRLNRGGRSGSEAQSIRADATFDPDPIP